MRAGYENWSEEAEQLARAAAGAACVKARQAAPSAASASPGGLNSTAVRARGDSAASGTPAAESASAQADSGSGDGDAKQKDKDEESWNPFSDLKFNEVSARPGKKPYERRRESTEKED